MDASARQEISRQLEVEPVAVCPSDCLPYNRPRLAWCSIELELTQGVQFERVQDYVRIHMNSSPLRDEQWLTPGWQREEDIKIPTFMKAIPRSKPPPVPAGLQRCDSATVTRWESDSFRFPPYQYQQCYLVSDGEGNMRYLNSEERELLLGFGWQHTRSAFSASTVKQNEGAFEDKRLSLCGDSFSMLSFGWIISQMVKEWVPALSPEQIILRFGLAPGAGLAPHLTAPLSRQLNYVAEPSLIPEGESPLIAHLSRHVNHTGSDVSLALGTPFSAKTPSHASLRADWWTWKILFRTRWKFESHINYLEMKMILQSLRWRARSAQALNARWVHLSDSMVSNYILAKGRTSSQLLQPLTKEIAAYVLALNSNQLYGHVDSIENPTDGASRETTDPEGQNSG